MMSLDGHFIRIASNDEITHEIFVGHATYVVPYLSMVPTYNVIQRFEC